MICKRANHGRGGANAPPPERNPAFYEVHKPVKKVKCGHQHPIDVDIGAVTITIFASPHTQKKQLIQETP